MNRFMKIGVIALLSSTMLSTAGWSQNTVNVNSNSTSNSASGATSNSSSTSGASNQGNAQNITFNNPAPPTTTTSNINDRVSGGTSSTIQNTGFTQSDITVRSAPQVYAPPVSGGNPCTLAVSGGVSVIGWGAAAGGTFVDQDCANRQKIAMIHNAGYAGAAKELMCNDQATYYAFRTAGAPCAVRPEWEAKAAAPVVAAPVPIQPGARPPLPTTPAAAPMVQVQPKNYPRCNPRAGIVDNCVSG